MASNEVRMVFDETLRVVESVPVKDTLDGPNMGDMENIMQTSVFQNYLVGSLIENYENIASIIAEEEGDIGGEDLTSIRHFRELFAVLDTAKRLAAVEQRTEDDDAAADAMSQKMKRVLHWLINMNADSPETPYPTDFEECWKTVACGMLMAAFSYASYSGFHQCARVSLLGLRIVLQSPTAFDRKQWEDDFRHLFHDVLEALIAEERLLKICEERKEEEKEHRAQKEEMEQMEQQIKTKNKSVLKKYWNYLKGKGSNFKDHLPLKKRYKTKQEEG